MDVFVGQGIVASYFLIGFSLEAPRFFLMWFTTYMLGLAGISIGMMFAYLLPNQAVIAIFMGLSQVRF